MTFKLGLSGISSLSITSSGRSPSGSHGRNRVAVQTDKTVSGTPHPLETDRRLPLFTGWTRRVASDQVVKALTDDDVPVFGADLIRHIVRFVATQELDPIGLFPLARPPIPACHRPSKLLDHVLKNFGHIHLINLYKILMPWRKRSILRV